MEARTPRPWFRALACCLCCLTLSAVGCASGAVAINMIPEDFELLRTHSNSVRVQTAGGRETEWYAGSQISDEAFLEALYHSLEKSSVFSKVVTEGEADYFLDVFITDVVQPLMAFNMHVSVVANWTLTKLPSKKVVLKELIPTPYTATVGDALMGLKRLRLANEGAARANIREGIRRISELEL